MMRTTYDLVHIPTNIFVVGTETRIVMMTDTANHLTSTDTKLFPSKRSQNLRRRSQHIVNLCKALPKPEAISSVGSMSRRLLTVLSCLVVGVPNASCFTAGPKRGTSSKVQNYPNHVSKQCPGMVVGNPDVSTSASGDTDDNWWVEFDVKHKFVSEKTRPDFNILFSSIGTEGKPLVYLDSGATSQKPKQVIEALSHYYEQVNSNVHRGAHTLSREATTAYEAARDSVASFVNANSRNEIVFTSGATAAINLVKSTYGQQNLQAGDEIILSVMEHHSNLVPWQILAESTGAVIRYVEVDHETGGLDLKQLESFLNSKTKIVGFQHVSNVMACINPVKEIVSMVRSKAPEAKILLDACQSVPHMKVDVQDLGVDFLAASGHKMCGPTGIGFLWGKEDLLNSMPPFMGGGEMIDQVTLEGATFAQAPGRFEAGTPPIAQAIGLGAAIKYLEEIGMDNVEAYEHELASYLHKRLSEVDGVKVLGPPEGVDRAALCAFVVDEVHPSDLSTFLDMEGVAVRAGHHCCQPLHQTLGISHSARASLYIYNTKEDVDILIAKLEKTLDFFRNLQSPTVDNDSIDDDFVPFI